MEAREGARLSPRTFLDPPHALLPTHISLRKKSLDFVWLITYGHHRTLKGRLCRLVVPNVVVSFRPAESGLTLRNLT